MDVKVTILCILPMCSICVNNWTLDVLCKYPYSCLSHYMRGILEVELQVVF
jgi:hypothetical protein